MGALLGRHTIVRMRTVEAVRAVTPVVSKTSSRDARRHILIVKGHYRQELHVGDTKLFEIWDFLYQAPEFFWMLYG